MATDIYSASCLPANIQGLAAISLFIFKKEWGGILTKMYLPSETIGVYCELQDYQVKHLN